MAKKKSKEKNGSEKSGHAHKTNAIRLVEAAGISYKMYTYDAPDGFMDGLSVARTLGQDPEQVFKTLVTWSSNKEYFVCVIPVGEELDLKKAAKHFGVKKIEMIPSRDITKVTGYIKGGCSPIGMKKPFPTAIHISASDFDSIIVSGGRVGLQMELPVNALLEMTAGSLADLVN